MVGCYYSSYSGFLPFHDFIGLLYLEGAKSRIALFNIDSSKQTANSNVARQDTGHARGKKDEEGE